MGGQQSIAGLPYEVGEAVWGRGVVLSRDEGERPGAIVEPESSGAGVDNMLFAVPRTFVAQHAETAWTAHRGRHTGDGHAVSVFVLETAHCSAARVAQARRNVLKLKTLRHPGFLHYEADIEVEGRIYLVVGAVRPLAYCIEELHTQPAALAWGLRVVARSLQFLHSETNASYHVLSPRHVFVDKNGDWRLGTLDLVDAKTPPVAVLNEYLPASFLPPEVQDMSGSTPQDGKALDSWLFACLVYAVFTNRPLNSPQDLKRVASQLPESLLPLYRRLLNTKTTQRASMQEVMQSPFFEQPLVQSLEFLEELAVKDAHQKDAFFRSLPEHLSTFPPQLCQYKILPLLVNGLDYGAANWRVMTPLLAIGRQLSPVDYAQFISPHLAQWFATTDPQLLINLLQHMDELAPHLSADLVNQRIYASLEKAFQSQNPKLRTLGLRACLPVAAKLSSEHREKGLLRYLAQLQVDPDQETRANTTICLAKLSSSLTESTRKRVLVPAFCRPLNDTFAPSRIAALTAFSATKEYYSPDDVARRIVPNMIKLTIDPVSDVRAKAFTTIDAFLEVLREVSQRMEPGVAASGAATPSIVRGKDGRSIGHTPEPGPRAVDVASTKLLNWASGVGAVVASKIIGESPVSASATGTKKSTASAHQQNSQRTATTAGGRPTASSTAHSEKTSKSQQSAGDGMNLDAAVSHMEWEPQRPLDQSWDGGGRAPSTGPRQAAPSTPLGGPTRSSFVQSSCNSTSGSTFRSSSSASKFSFEADKDDWEQADWGEIPDLTPSETRPSARPSSHFSFSTTEAARATNKQPAPLLTAKKSTHSDSNSGWESLDMSDEESFDDDSWESTGLSSTSADNKKSSAPTLLQPTAAVRPGVFAAKTTTATSTKVVAPSSRNTVASTTRITNTGGGLELGIALKETTISGAAKQSRSGSSASTGWKNEADDWMTSEDDPWADF